MKRKWLWLFPLFLAFFAAWFLWGNSDMRNAKPKLEFQENTAEPIHQSVMQPTSLNPKEVEQIFNRKGSNQGEVFKMSFPRSDLTVKVGDVQVDPALALTSWVAFKPARDEVMMMGDLVLLDEELTPVMKKLVEKGIEVTALHNHLVLESPSIIYLHFSAHGDPLDLSKKIKSVLSVTQTPLTQTDTNVQTKSVQWSKIESIIGFKGKSKGDVIHFSIPRKEQILDMHLVVHGVTVPPEMGVATAINFQKVGKKAATTGDFVLLAEEVTPVVRTLTKYGIMVTAVHNHMLVESPRLFFVHFWGIDDPEKLAHGLKDALNRTNSNQREKEQ
jgi:hypothetical protein